MKNQLVSPLNFRLLIPLILPIVFSGTLYFLLGKMDSTKELTFFSNSVMPESLNIFTFDKIGQYYRLGKEIENGLEGDLVKNVEVNVSDGSLDNLKKVANVGSPNSIGFCQSDVYHYYKDITDFEDTINFKDNVIPICELYMEKLHILERYDSKDTLNKKKIDSSPSDCILSLLKEAGKGKKNSGTLFTMRRLISYLNDNIENDKDKIDIIPSKEEEVYKSLVSLSCGSLKCATLTTRAPNQYIEKHLDLIMEDGKRVSFVGIDSSFIAKLNSRYFGDQEVYHSVNIDSSDYKNIDEDIIPTIGVRTFLIANSNIEDNLPDQIAKHLQEIKDSDDALKSLENIENISSIKPGKNLSQIIKKILLLLLIIIIPLLLSIWSYVWIINHVTKRKLNEENAELVEKNKELEEDNEDLIETNRQLTEVNSDLNIYSEEEIKKIAKERKYKFYKKGNSFCLTVDVPDKGIQSKNIEVKYDSNKVYKLPVGFKYFAAICLINKYSNRSLNERTTFSFNFPKHSALGGVICNFFNKKLQLNEGNQFGTRQVVARSDTGYYAICDVENIIFEDEFIENLKDLKKLKENIANHIEKS